jgi:hypothetical protein
MEKLPFHYLFRPVCIMGGNVANVVRVLGGNTLKTLPSVQLAPQTLQVSSLLYEKNTN